MQTNLLQKARDRRIAALQTLASSKLDNIFYMEEARSPRKRTSALQFSSARKAPADALFSSERRLAA